MARGPHHSRQEQVRAPSPWLAKNFAFRSCLPAVWIFYQERRRALRSGFRDHVISPRPFPATEGNCWEGLENPETGLWELPAGCVCLQPCGAENFQCRTQISRNFSHPLPSYMVGSCWVGSENTKNSRQSTWASQFSTTTAEFSGLFPKPPSYTFRGHS
jgi:hypothetical protein